MIGNMKDKSIMKSIKKDKVSLLILLFIFLIVFYVNIYITAVITKTIEVTQFIFGVWVIKELFTDNNKLKLFLCIAGLELVLFLYISMSKPDYKSKLIEITPDIYIPAAAGQGQCGDARFLRKEEYDKVFKSHIISNSIVKDDIHKHLIPSGGFVVGKEDVKGGEKIYYIDTDTHVLCLGATRSGKTRCCVLQTLGMLGLAGESIIASDPKGELVEYTKPYLEDLGYEVLTINYDEPVYSDCWNYLQPIIDFVDAGDVPAAIDATWDLTSQLVGESTGEKIWNNGEASVIAAAIMAIVYDNREGENKRYQNLANVYYFLINMCKSVVVGNRSILPLNVYVNLLPENHPAKALMGVSNVAPDKTRGSFFTSAVTTLKLFTNPYIANMSSKSSFRFEDFGKKKMALFFVLPEDRLTYHPLATLMVTQAYGILSKLAKRCGGRIPNRVNMVLDEAGNFSKMENLVPMLTMAGGKGIRFDFFVQDFAQFEEKYEKTGLRTIKSNCESWVYLQSNDPETRKEISEALDNYTTQSYSTNMNSNRLSTTVTSTGSSNNLTGRALLTPDNLKNLKRPYTLIIPVNHPVIMCSPDLSQWYFNTLFGMGDEQHNINLRVDRRSQRVKRFVSQEIDTWGIWNVIIERLQQEDKKLRIEEEQRNRED